MTPGQPLIPQGRTQDDQWPGYLCASSSTVRSSSSASGGSSSTRSNASRSSNEKATRSCSASSASRSTSAVSSNPAASKSSARRAASLLETDTPASLTSATLPGLPDTQCPSTCFASAAAQAVRCESQSRPPSASRSTLTQHS